jgi:hypothetical protein
MNDQRWRELCQLIMIEKDPQKLLALVRDLNQELERREQELRDRKAAGDGKLGIVNTKLPEEPT